jgi:hypothetical protein
MKTLKKDGELYDTDIYKEWVHTFTNTGRTILFAKYTDKSRPSKDIPGNSLAIECGFELKSKTPTQEEIHTLRSIVLNELIYQYSND